MTGEPSLGARSEEPADARSTALRVATARRSGLRAEGRLVPPLIVFLLYVGFFTSVSPHVLGLRWIRDWVSSGGVGASTLSLIIFLAPWLLVLAVLRLVRARRELSAGRLPAEADEPDESHRLWVIGELPDAEELVDVPFEPAELGPVLPTRVDLSESAGLERRQDSRRTLATNALGLTVFVAGFFAAHGVSAAIRSVSLGVDLFSGPHMPLKMLTGILAVFAAMTYFMPTHLRIVPQRLEVVVHRIGGAGRPWVRAIDLSQAVVVVDFVQQTLFITHDGAQLTVRMWGMAQQRLLVYTTLRAALSSHSPPPGSALAES